MIKAAAQPGYKSGVVEIVSNSPINLQSLIENSSFESGEDLAYYLSALRQLIKNSTSPYKLTNAESVKVFLPRFGFKGAQAQELEKLLPKLEALNNPANIDDYIRNLKEAVALDSNAPELLTSFIKQANSFTENLDQSIDKLFSRWGILEKDTTRINSNDFKTFSDQAREHLERQKGIIESVGQAVSNRNLDGSYQNYLTLSKLVSEKVTWLEGKNKKSYTDNLLEKLGFVIKNTTTVSEVQNNGYLLQNIERNKSQLQRYIENPSLTIFFKTDRFGHESEFSSFMNSLSTPVKVTSGTLAVCGITDATWKTLPPELREEAIKKEYRIETGIPEHISKIASYIKDNGIEGYIYRTPFITNAQELLDSAKAASGNSELTLGDVVSTTVYYFSFDKTKGCICIHSDGDCQNVPNPSINKEDLNNSTKKFLDIPEGIDFAVTAEPFLANAHSIVANVSSNEPKRTTSHIVLKTLLTDTANPTKHFQPSATWGIACNMAQLTSTLTRDNQARIGTFDEPKSPFMRLKDSPLGTKDSPLGTKDSPLGTKDSPLGK